MKRLIFLFALAGTGAFNQATAQMAMPDTATKNFIIKASIGNLNEIASGQLAEKKATDAEVRSFGSRMVADHSKAETELLQIAKSKGFDIPQNATMPPVPDAMLKNASGRDFDRIYIHMMVPGHRTTVYLFQTYALGGKDPDLKAFAQRTLPIIKEHLAAITAIDNKMKDLAAK